MRKLLHTPYLLHTDAFTHGGFYTETLLHKEAFTHTRFDAQNPDHTTPPGLHAMSCVHSQKETKAT